MPLTLPVKPEDLKDHLGFKFYAGLPISSTEPLHLKYAAMNEISYRYTLLGLYPDGRDNRYYCFCRAQANVRVVNRELMSAACGTQLPRYFYYVRCKIHFSLLANGNDDIEFLSDNVYSKMLHTGDV